MQIYWLQLRQHWQYNKTRGTPLVFYKGIKMEEQTSSPVLTLHLNVEQINAVLGALGKLPTETGVWPLLKEISEQATAQFQALQSQNAPEETSTVQ